MGLRAKINRRAANVEMLITLRRIFLFGRRMERWQQNGSNERGYWGAGEKGSRNRGAKSKCSKGKTGRPGRKRGETRGKSLSVEFCYLEQTSGNGDLRDFKPQEDSMGGENASLTARRAFYLLVI